MDFCKEWIVDFGHSNHARGNASLLFNVHLHCDSCEWSILFKMDISSDGDVFHFLGLKKNLASVSQMVDSARYVQILSNVKNITVDHLFHFILFTGKRKESLYILSASDAYVEKMGQNASITLWYV